MNLFQYPMIFRIFFVLILFHMSNAVQAGLRLKAYDRHRVGGEMTYPEFKEYIQNYSDSGIKNISEGEAEFLAKALKEPMLLVNSAGKKLFKSDGYRNLFFRNFNFSDDNRSLLTRLLYQQVEGGLKELPFDEAKRNWENFINALEQARLAGHTQIQRIDMEAAAISFVRKNSYTLYPYRLYISYIEGMRPGVGYRRALEVRGEIDDMTTSILQNPASEDTLIYLFDDLHSLDASTYFRYYENPHFQLPIDDPYRFAIVYEILKDPSVVHTKESILKIWIDVSRREPRTSMSINQNFLEERLYNSLRSHIYRNGEAGHSNASSLQNHDENLYSIAIENDPFLMAVSAASRENEDLMTFFHYRYEEVLLSYQR